jgi:hypothetical protein
MQHKPAVHRVVMAAHGTKNIGDPLYPLTGCAEYKPVIEIVRNQ